MSNSPLMRLDMALIKEGSHSFTCHPHTYPQVEWTIPAFTSQPQSVTACWPVLIFRPAEGRGWVGLCAVCSKVSIVFSAIIDYMCRDFTSRRRVSWNELSRQLVHRSTFISVRRSQAAVQYERFNSNSASLNVPTNLSITTSSSTLPPSRPTGHLFQVT